MNVKELLGQLEANMSPSSLRDLSATILRLADSIDQDWDSAQIRSTLPWFSKSAKIEQNAMSLAFSATKEEHRARLREDVFGFDLLGIPAWNMLLELFKQHAGGAKVSTKTLQIISGCPETTALRIIGRLERRGLVARTHSDGDRRVTFVSLTRDGMTKVGTVLERLSD
jgi:DNA-binding MarR family transcriptional regulator